MRRKRNIEQGYMAGGVFHPIRASSDYNPKRAGDMGDRSMSEYARRRRKNPTKLQRLINSTKRAKAKRMAKALSEYLKVRNPGTKFAGAKVMKNPGGSITIIPIKLKRDK